MLSAKIFRRVNRLCGEFVWLPNITPAPSTITCGPPSPRHPGHSASVGGALWLLQNVFEYRSSFTSVGFSVVIRENTPESAQF